MVTDRVRARGVVLRHARDDAEAAVLLDMLGLADGQQDAHLDENVDRHCQECGTPIIPRTRYKLDPAGYRERGVRLFTANGRCHACYNRQRRQPAAGAA